MKYCEKCGNVKDDDKVFCQKCEEKIYAIQNEQNHLSGAEDKNKTTNGVVEQKKKRTNFGVVLLWILFLPIMGIIAIVKSSKIKKPLKTFLIIILVIYSGISTLVVITAVIGDSKPIVSSFTIRAGEFGDYGSEMTLNKGTEFEETQIIYRIPVGTYTITNVGENTGMVSIYSEEIRVSEAGWEEPAVVYGVFLLKVGESVTIVVGEKQYLEIHQPCVFEFNKVNTTNISE